MIYLRLLSGLLLSCTEFSKEQNILPITNPPGGLHPYKRPRPMGMCRWMGPHIHDWIDYNGVAFSIELLEWERMGVRQFFIFTVSKRTRMFVL